jgi:hypothetical protein
MLTLSQKDAVNQYYVHTEADLVKTDSWAWPFSSSNATILAEKGNTHGGNASGN